MPQQQKHASHAARQAAYRDRCRRARQIELTTKGLPALPAISNIPGWPRWNATLKTAHGLLEQALGEMQEYFDDRLEAWQEGQRGEEHQERIDELEEVTDALSALLM